MGFVKENKNVSQNILLGNVSSTALSHKCEMSFQVVIYLFKELIFNKNVRLKTKSLHSSSLKSWYIGWTYIKDVHILFPVEYLIDFSFFYKYVVALHVCVSVMLFTCVAKAKAGLGVT